MLLYSASPWVDEPPKSLTQRSFCQLAICIDSNRWDRGHYVFWLSVRLWVYKPLKSVTHGQCDAGPTVTFPAAEHHRPLTGTNILLGNFISFHYFAQNKRIVKFQCTNQAGIAGLKPDL